jgi:hypothetical protein
VVVEARIVVVFDYKRGWRHAEISRPRDELPKLHTSHQVNGSNLALKMSGLVKVKEAAVFSIPNF